MLKSAQQKARTTNPRDLSGPSKPKPFRVRRRKGGFRIFFGDRRSERPERIEVKVAYDRRNGSPLRKYSSEDFTLDQRPIEITADGADVEVLAGNQMAINVTDDAFDVAVTGFDLNRDLYLDVRQRLEESAPSANKSEGR